MNGLTKIFVTAASSGALALGTAIAAQPAFSASFTAIRIGDVDGFGYGSGVGYKAANGNPANADGTGVLGTGDFLPDLNRNGAVATGQGDDFDNRSAAEKANKYLTGDGFIDKGSSGSAFTDISLSTSFRDTFPNTKNYPFPGDGDPVTTAGNQPGFLFKFFVDGKDTVKDAPLFFNLVFGDYDVVPAEVLFTRADGSTFIKPVTTQPGNQDGLIQAAFVELGFNDVFTAAGSGYDGFLKVDFLAPNEPYTAFDFAEISPTKIPISVPEPTTTAGLLAFGAGATYMRKRRYASQDEK